LPRKQQKILEATFLLHPVYARKFHHIRSEAFN